MRSLEPELGSCPRRGRGIPAAGTSSSATTGYSRQRLVVERELQDRPTFWPRQYRRQQRLRPSAAAP